MEQGDGIWDKIYSGIAKRRGLGGQKTTNDVVAFSDSPVRMKYAPEDEYAINRPATDVDTLDAWAANPNKQTMNMGLSSDGSSIDTTGSSTSFGGGSPDWSSLYSQYGGGLKDLAAGYLANRKDYQSNMGEQENLLNKSTLASAGVADRMTTPGKIQSAGPWQVIMGSLEQEQADKQKAAEEALSKEYMQTNKDSAKRYQDYLDMLIRKGDIPGQATAITPPPPTVGTAPVKKQIKTQGKSIVKKSVATPVINRMGKERY